jgi:hypothetical protein
MAITPQDLLELKRFAVNARDEDKAFLYRLIKSVGDDHNHIRALKAENGALKKELEALKGQNV